MLTRKREEELVGLCRDLVRCPSVSGDEGRIASLVKDVMLSLGYDSVEVDYYGNVIGRITFSSDPGTLLMEAQMDQVEVQDPSEWSCYPFGAFVESGRIYGRGASDQKGSLSAMILAGAALKERWADGRLGGQLIVAATVQQERFEGVSSRLIAQRYHPDRVVIGEASGLRIERGQRGRAEVIVETLGRMAHSANPRYGVNAALHMVSVLSAIGDRFLPKSHSFLGEGILELTNLVSFPERNTGAVPSRCRAVFDRRLLLEETREGVLEQISRIVEEVSQKIPDLDARVCLSAFEDTCYTGVPVRGEHFAPAWLLEEDHPFVQAALKGLESVSLAPELSTKAGFGTNGSYYGAVAGIPTIGFGPSVESLAHVVDEYIEIDQLVSGFRGYCGIAAETLRRA